MDDERRNDGSREASELEKAKEIVEGHEVSDSQRFSLDEIMSEYRYNATIAPRSRRHGKKGVPSDMEPISQDTMALKSLVEEMKSFSRQVDGTDMPARDPREAARDTGKPDENRSALDDFQETQQSGAAGPDGADEYQFTPDPSLFPPAAQDDLSEPEIIVTTEIDFGPSDDFGRAFSPSDDFVGDQHTHGGAPEDIPEQPVREDSVLDRIRRRSRRREPIVRTLPVDKAAGKLIPYIRFFTLRLVLAGVICLLMVLITFSHRMPISMPAFMTFISMPYSYMGILTVLQILVMICGIDVLARGLSDLCHFRPGMESAALLSCVANILYTFSVFVNPQTATYLPYCAVAALSVLCTMWSHRLRFVAYQRTYKTAAMAEYPYVVMREEPLWKGGAFVKARGNIDEFVGLTEQPDGAMRFAHFLVPLGLLASLLFAVVASVGHELNVFFWAFSATMSVVSPFCGPFSFSLPFYKTVKRLVHSHAALAGWTGVRAFFDPAVAVLTDRDIFPPGTVNLNGLKVFGSFNFDRMISYAASLVEASGSGVAHTFAELLKGQSAAIREVHNFQHYENGGIGADIDSDRVLLGNSAFMLRMGIRLPQGIKLQHAVFVAVNLDLAGIFAVTYTPTNQVRAALSMLLRHGITPVFATRDANLTPEFVGKMFELNLSAAVYPPIEQRLMLSDPGRETHAKPVAVVGREGLLPYAESIAAGRRMGQVTRANLLVYLLCALLGLALLAFLVIKGEASTASPCNVLIYLGLWLLPALLVSGWANRY